MFEITYLDNYRLGIFSMKEKIIKTPALLEIKKDFILLGNLTIQRPEAFTINEPEADLKTAPLMHVPFRIPLSVAEKMTRENMQLLEKEKECIPISITQYREINEKFFENLYDASIFFFFRCEEKAFVESVAFLRKKFPNTLFYARCQSHEIPIYLMLGFDLFNHSKENEEAVKIFMQNPTKSYVEKEANASIHTKRLLRLMYYKYDDFEIYAKNKRQKETYISYDSLFRPEVERFRRMISERYFPPTNVFVLLPCSARKPYSSSPSHLKIISALKKGAGKHYAALTQLILTSPLGVVPRELEELVDYDTVVTGFWSHEEICYARQVLQAILAKSENPIIITHLPEEYKRICEGLGEMVYTCDGQTTSEASLKKLSETVSKVTLISEGKRDMQKDRIRTISTFTFGEDIFPEDFSIRGRWVKNIIADGKVLATWSRHLFPTLEGALRMNNYWVNIDFNLHGDVFCAGILDADDRIRAGDIVCIRKEGKVCGVGKALLPGLLMKKMKHGKAVAVKHKI